MRFIRKLIAVVTVGAVTTVVGTWVLDTTVLNAGFVTSSLKDSRFYDQLSEDLPNFLAQSPDPATQASAEVIAAVLTPSYIERKADDFIFQLERQHRHGGPAAQLDLSDLGRLAERDGFSLPDVPDQPLSIGESSEPGQPSPLFSNIKLIKYAGIPVALVLLALAWAAGEATRRWRSVPRLLLISGVALLPNFLIFKGLPQVLGGLFKRGEQTGPLAPSVRLLLEAVFSEAAPYFLWAAGVLAVVSALWFGLGMILGRHHRPPKPSRSRRRDEGGMIPPS